MPDVDVTALLGDLIEGLRMDGGWSNAFTGMGMPDSDKRQGAQHLGCHLSYHDIARLWETNDIAAKAIEAPSAECFREGYEITISSQGKYDDFRDELEDAIGPNGLNLDAQVESAYQIKRAFGGSAMLLGVDERGKAALTDPLDLSKVSALKYLNVYEPIEIEPASYYEDPLAANYKQPKYFRLTGAKPLGPGFGPTTPALVEQNITIAPQYVHESRLIVFQGIKTSGFYPPANRDISPFWGAGIMPRFYDALRDCDVGFASAGLLATDTSTPIISIEGLKEMVAKNAAKVAARARAIELSRTNFRAILIDAKEKYERQTTNLSNIPELLDRLSQRVAAAVGVPLSVLFGYSPATLGSPGNMELTLWYNFCRAIQRRELTPRLQRVIEMKMRTMRQRALPKYTLEWHELEHMTQAQRLEAELNQARKDTLDVRAGAIWPQEIRKARARRTFKNQIDISKPAPGFLAPLPQGVMPKAMSAPAEIESKQAGNKPAAAGGAQTPAAAPASATAHVVRGYARRNPATPSETVKVGGDSPPGNKDADDLVEMVSQSALKKRKRKRGGMIPTEEELEMLGVHGVDDDVEASEGQADEDSAGPMIGFAGLPFVIENPVGSTRSWVDAQGRAGETTMQNAYGYIPGINGTDGDCVDAYLGPDESAPWIYVVHQRAAPDFTQFDEDKILLGFSSPDAAMTAYRVHMTEPRVFGGMTMMPLEDFRQKVGGMSGQKITN